jgi:hypothetical protein
MRQVHANESNGTKPHAASFPDLNPDDLAAQVAHSAIIVDQV